MPSLFKDKKRRDAEIPTASMADIAFLLLIFFLVTTIIDVDTGIGMTLPPKLEEDVDPPPVKERNMLKILVNAQGQVLLEDKPSAVSMIQGEVKKHITNMGADPNYAEEPSKAIVSLKTDRGTQYDLYITVLDEIMLAYQDVWNAQARQRGFENYTAYKDALAGQENEIRGEYPLGLSIAEPDPGT